MTSAAGASSAVSQKKTPIYSPLSFPSQIYQIDQWTSIIIKPLNTKCASPRGDTITKGLGISFECSRMNEDIAGDVQAIYQKCIRGQGHDDLVMIHKPDPLKPHETKGMNGNVRRNLWECRCTHLNRKMFPIRRRTYEDLVISKILKIIGQQQQPFTLQLAMLCSGGLLGEEILLFRLIDELKQEGLIGTIYLSLIDHVNGNAIYDAAKCFQEKAYKSPEQIPLQLCLPDATGKQHGLAQFLFEIAKCLPQSIQVKGTAFYDDKAYIAAMRKESSYKHDLLVGADMEGSDRFLRPLQIQSESRHNAIGLDQTDDGKVEIYEIDSSGMTVNRLLVDDS